MLPYLFSPPHLPRRVFRCSFTQNWSDWIFSYVDKTQLRRVCVPTAWRYVTKTAFSPLMPVIPIKTGNLSIKLGTEIWIAPVACHVMKMPKICFHFNFCEITRCWKIWKTISCECIDFFLEHSRFHYTQTFRHFFFLVRNFTLHVNGNPPTSCFSDFVHLFVRLWSLPITSVLLLFFWLSFISTCVRISLFSMTRCTSGYESKYGKRYRSNAVEPVVTAQPFVRNDSARRRYDSTRVRFNAIPFSSV